MIDTKFYLPISNNIKVNIDNKIIVTVGCFLSKISIIEIDQRTVILYSVSNIVEIK